MKNMNNYSSGTEVDSEEVNNYSLETDIDNAAINVVQLLQSQKKRLATAESCTGGLISAAVTSVSGSSEVFDLGICTYAAEMKTHFLGVEAALIEEKGVVSIEVAQAMAAGIRRTAAADFGIATTGVAGPSGGTGGIAEIPVGTVCIGFSTENIAFAEKFVFTVNNCPKGMSERQFIRLQAVKKALEIVQDNISTYK